MPSARATVQEFLQACAACQRHKTEHLYPVVLLLPVPTIIWPDVSMDFIKGLPKVGNKSVILTVVDRFSKYAHFIMLSHTRTPPSLSPRCSMLRLFAYMGF